MSGEGFIAVVWPRTAEQNSGGKRSRAGRKSERSGERELCCCVLQGDFFVLVRIGFYGSLRADQLKKLVGALKIQLLLGAVLRPASVDGRFCGVKRAIVNAAHHGNFKVKAGLL